MSTFKTAHHRWLHDLWLIFLAAALVGFVLANEPLRRIALNLRPILAALGFLASFCGWGWPLVRWLGPKRQALDELLLAVAVGLGLTGSFTFGLGLAGFINPVLYALWTCAGLALFVVALAKLPRAPLELQPPSALTAFSLCVATPFILQVIPPLVTPVVSRDALEYHLLMPKLYLAAGEIVHLPSLVESSYPSLASYVYLLVMPLAGGVVCKSVHFFVCMLLLAALGRLVTKAHAGSNSFLAPALFMAMPVIACISGWAWNDGLFVFFFVLCVSLVIDYQKRQEDHSARDLVLAGVMAGLASWTKYTFVLVTPAIVAIAIVGVVRWGWRWRHVPWLFAPWGLISMTWIVKNWSFTGNPVYPFLHRVFPSEGWTDAAAQFFHGYLTRLEIPDWTWATYLLFPWNVAVAPRIIDAQIGVIPLALAVLLFAKSPNREVSLLKLFVAVTTLSWLLFQTENRSLLTMLAVLTCAGSIHFERTIWSHNALRRPVLLFLGLACIANLGIAAVVNYHLTKPLDVFIGREDRASYLRREATSQPVIEWLNDRSEVGVVLLVGIQAPYYLQHPALFSSCCDPPIVEVLTHGVESSAGLREVLGQLGITHVAVRWDVYQRNHDEGLFSWEEAERRAFEEMLDNQCLKVKSFGNEEIFAFR